MQRSDGEGKQKNRRILCGRKSVRCRAKISVVTQTKLFTNTAFCVCTWISRSFRILPAPICGLGRIGKHHILWLISPCHSQCSMVSEVCQGFWPRPVPGTRWMLQFCYVDQKNSPCGGRILKESFIQQQTNGHPTFGCPFAYVVPKRNAPEWCV